MKKRTILMAAVTLIAGMAGAVQAAAPYIPPPATPLYIKFDNKEQIAGSQLITAPSGKQELNWGIVKVDTIYKGSLLVDPQNFNPTGTPLWANNANSEITGIFYGLQRSPNQSALNATNGWLDLYYDDTPDADLASATLNQRTADNQFTNFTDGTFLMRVAFMNGAILAGDPLTSVTGSANPVVGGFAGQASSYGEVDLLTAGLWSALFNGDYFTTALINDNADLKFRNIYENTGHHDWDMLDPNGVPLIFGAQSSDPARAYTVPEPSTFALLGFGLLGAGFMARRKKS